MNIRKARPNDIGICVDIELPGKDDYRKTIRKDLTRQVKNNQYLFMIYEINKEVVGFITARKEDWNNSFYIEKLYVKEEYRNKGYGKKLLLELIKNVRKLKSRIIFLDLNPKNKKAISFYNRNGFEMAGRINDFHGEPNKPYAVIMSYKI